MKQLVLAAAIATAAFAAQAQGGTQTPSLCDTCAQVQSVHKETRKGKGGATGIVGGAVVGGLIGNQFGHGNGKALATVGGAAAGGFAGNEVQKHVTSKDIWVTKVQLRDGSSRTFENQSQPSWKSGSLVKVNGRTLALYVAN